MLGDSGRLADGGLWQDRPGGWTGAGQWAAANVAGVNHPGALLVHGGRARAFGCFPVLAPTAAPVQCVAVPQLRSGPVLAGGFTGQTGSAGWATLRP